MNDVLLSPLRLSELESLIEKSVTRAFQLNSQTGTALTNQGTDDILTVPEVAEFLTVSIPTIYALTSKGDIPCFKRGRRVYFSKEEVIKFLKKGRKKTNTEIMAEAEAYTNKKGRKHG